LRGLAYETVEKVSSDVFRPCMNFVLRHNVQLAHKNKSGERQHYHQEFTYASSKYMDARILKSIRLNFNSYLSLEETGKDWTDKEFVRIDYRHIRYLTKTLKRVLEWFYEPEFDKLFAYSDETKQELVVSLDFKDLQEAIRIGQTIIRFTPAVIYHDVDCYEGVMMCVGKSESFGHMTIDSLEAMYHIISNFDLHLAGLAIVNYMGIPEEGKYNTDMEIDQRMSGNSMRSSFIESKGNLNNIGKEEPAGNLKGFFKSI